MTTRKNVAANADRVVDELSAVVDVSVVLLVDVVVDPLMVPPLVPLVLVLLVLPPLAPVVLVLLPLPLAPFVVVDVVAIVVVAPSPFHGFAASKSASVPLHL